MWMVRIAMARSSSFGSQHTVFMRGGQGNYVRVLVDGVPLTEGKQLPLGPGGTVLLRIPGGSGMGDPLKRDRNMVERDLAKGLVTESHARDCYGYTGPGRG